MGKLIYFRWMTDDAEILKENLTTEQIGELFVAVMDYLRDGTINDVSECLKLTFADYRKKVDRARCKYEEICTKRADNGKKGGIAKAANASKAMNEIENFPLDFKPPTLSQFRNYVRDKYLEYNYYRDEDEADEYEEDSFPMPSKNEVDSFYYDLKKSGWKIGSEPIRNEKELIDAISSKFFSILKLEYKVFEYIFSTRNGFRDSDGESKAEEAAYFFCESITDKSVTPENLSHKIEDFLTTYKM